MATSLANDPTRNAFAAGGWKPRNQDQRNVDDVFGGARPKMNSAVGAAAHGMDPAALMRQDTGAMFNPAGQEIGTTGGLIPGGMSLPMMPQPSRPVGPMDPAGMQQGSMLPDSMQQAGPGAPRAGGRPGGYSYTDPTTQRMQRALAIGMPQQAPVAEIAEQARSSYDTGRDLARNINPFIPGPNTPPEKAANDLAYLDKLALSRAGMGPRPGAPTVQPVGPMDPANADVRAVPQPSTPPPVMGGMMTPESLTPRPAPRPIGPQDPGASRAPAPPAAMPLDYFPAVRGTDARGNPTLTQSPESLAVAATLRNGGPMNPWAPSESGGNARSAAVRQVANLSRDARMPGFATAAEAQASIPEGSTGQVQQSKDGRWIAQYQVGNDKQQGPQSGLAKMQADLARAESEGRAEDATALRQQIDNETNPSARPMSYMDWSMAHHQATNTKDSATLEYLGSSYGGYRRKLSESRVASNPTPTGEPPVGAVARLKADPSLRAAFDAKYGAGAAAKILGK